MCTIYLIRHGQASFQAQHYDVLSELGRVQAEQLGKHLGPLDAIYHGPRARQRDTARCLSGADLVLLEDLDEYPAEPVIRYCLGDLLQGDAALLAMYEEAAAEGAEPLKNGRFFQEVLERSLRRWQSGQVQVPGQETFGEFRARVRRALWQMKEAHGRRQRVALVTSGGPVGVGLGEALGLSDERVMRMSWVVANSSLSELRWRRDELVLMSWNGVPHLRAPEQVTYR